MNQITLHFLLILVLFLLAILSTFPEPVKYIKTAFILYASLMIFSRWIRLESASIHLTVCRPTERVGYFPGAPKRLGVP